jgi:hypothetical protein
VTGTPSRPAAGTEIPVPVTQDHLDRGAPEDACGCAVALAVTDAVRALGLVPEVDSVSVMYEDGQVDAAAAVAASARVWIQPAAWLRLTFGADAARLMWAVDTGQPAGPCTLTGTVA